MRRSLRGLLLTCLIAVVVSPLGPVEPAQAADRHRILITGDSITQGSAGDYTWRYRLWAKLARTAPGSSFVGTRSDLYDVVNRRPGSRSYAAGFPATAHAAGWGDSYRSGVGTIAAQVRSTKPDVLVVMLGGNDLSHLTSPLATIANVRTYIARARAARPGLDVVVGEVPTRYDPWSRKYQLRAQAADYASRLRALADRLDTGTERVVTARTGDGWDPARHTWDGTHPNSTGEALIAQRVSQALARIGIGSAGPDVSGTRSWSVPGPAATLEPGADQVALTWNRAATGSTGMYVEQRLRDRREAWRRMPYAVAANGWVSKQLTAGGRYEFRLVPVKGSSVGRAGPVTRATVTGPKPGPIKSIKVTAGGNSLYGGKVGSTTWSRSAHANAYLVAQRRMSNGKLVWEDLPYPVTKPAWTFQGLEQGRRYEFRMRGARGFLRGAWRTSAVTRMRGWAMHSVQVSLGDSYSAGLGSRRQYTDYRCLRSTSAWPYAINKVARALISHPACSGARVPGVREQVKTMNKVFGSRRGSPQLVTLTIGGNDVGFVGALEECVRQNCVSRERDLVERIDRVQALLRTVYREVRKAQPFADIVVGGYPSVVEPGDVSSDFVCLRFTADERNMIARLASRLNARITAAAKAAGVWSVGQRVRDAFRGHNVCSGRPWINGVAIGYGGHGNPISPKSFHPNDLGQAGYAKVFQGTLNGLFR
ncbi:GDSL-type esterase/lipase family protein [Nocardioides marmoriginsengisoli]|uniref:GDSL-type esterase/lipase family protein n=1 Tax=Nocardioides marmoriginsengisoli TaxID=661483 RepID=UPI0011CE2263|nr:GDSL-type esterase/lipase family protein [Nocardioides marmoriginsengisoli]